jgi:translation initiation factor 1 (eIF-1/SUI1)
MAQATDNIEDSSDMEDMEDMDEMESSTEVESTSASASEITVDNSLAAKNREREELAKQIEEFLARGGTINEVDSNVCSDPPQKPSSNYGSRPI